MKCVINQENVEKIMEFLKNNLDYAVSLTNKEAKELQDFFVYQMNWDNFKGTKVEIINSDAKELYFTIKKDSDTFNNFVITDKLFSIHRTHTLEGILNKLSSFARIKTKINLTPTDDYAADSIKYFVKNSTGISIDSTCLTTTKKINKEEKEEDMFKILEIYKDKKTKEIEEKYDKEIKELEENDEAQVFIMQAEETLKSILHTETLKICVNSDVVMFTEETWKKRNEIVKKIREEKEKLNLKIDEILALLELAPNYEEKIKILRDYEIVDKKKNIIL